MYFSENRKNIILSTSPPPPSHHEPRDNNVAKAVHRNMFNRFAQTFEQQQQ